MTIKTTLAALLLSACTVPGLTTGSTSPSAPAAPPAPAASAPVAAETAPAAAPAPAPATAPAREIEARDAEPIDNAAALLAQITSGQATPAGGLREQTIRDEAMYCSQRVENLLGRDYPPTAKVPLENGDTTLGEADAKICQALAKTADSWTARSDQAHAAQNDALLEPYRKAGVTGDKLKLVDDLGKQLIGPGQADPTPAVVAKASVLFSLRHDGYRQWTIVRYVFKGNTQVAVTEKGYRDRPGPDQFR